MRKYQTLLFDVDNTLLDFSAAEDEALRLLFEDQDFPLTDEVKDQYKKINQSLWRLFEEGKIDRDTVMNTRHSRLFKEYGREVDGALLEIKYRNYLREGHQLVDGAFELISHLHNHFDLYIVTNGDSETQHKRLKDSCLYPFFKEIFVSDEIGFQKPQKEFFDYVFARIPNFSVEKGIIIGDSLSADIKGGYLSGIDSCWINPEMLPNDTNIIPTYQIQKLDELYHILTV
ncbi:noncanonical pyrimidine nucleotidase, YjjG family [Bacillus sp. Gen3]|uniref:YjjG family noncanonical pyrimidine nucleotidase n=1 Tax=Heyndrickxia oleronia TaxID=38875 RepID=UPI0015D29FE0|nr:YjjG family noncanonical pyrimidine nucleotidase [Heyndrickxia oleronia]MBU5211529.1 YjjG family noncanonical pyrimidine nucleotidase [Heyndrickxia oleronia]NYV65621.1 noncanonical pyrimidine nucleotidase, YjjG family [Bacillus sp. Gen3]